MDLRSDYPYWLLRHGIIRSYPPLQKNTHAEIVIMGGGISGALSAWYLTNAGFNTLLVDRRHIGMGSTAASTALLQYEIDTPLYKLIEKVGKESAIRSYLLCRQSIHTAGDIVHSLNIKHNFSFKPSFQYASFKKDRKNLAKEFRLRKEAGLRLNWLDDKDILDKYGFSSAGGILSEDGAEVDAYQLTHALLEDSISKGLRVYDHTDITAIQHHKNAVTLTTADNKKIKAGKLIIACGYESQQYIPKKVQDLRSTFVIISERYEKKDFWYKNSLIWETKDPYLYLRTTSDNRIIVGGKDSPFSDPNKRDKLLSSKARSLQQSFSQLFPSIPFRTDFKWAGSFASTKDGLPYIGAIPQRPHTYFALGLGGNGITFSVIAAEIICDILQGKKNENAGLFSFDR
jgi:glycine/D-amino acid oxidase-like deaminating enzyme